VGVLTRMRKVRRRTKLLLAGAFLAFIVLVVGCAGCVFFRIRHPRDVQAYLGMAAEVHPVWREFALRHFAAGDLAKDLVRLYPPRIAEEFGRYAVYRYSIAEDGSLPMSGLQVTARDGKLLSAQAGSCTWQFTLFETPDPLIDQEYRKYWDERRKKREKERRDKLAAKLVTFHEQFDRWPSNAKEFGTFVTGSTGGGTNPLSILLVEQSDGTMNVASIEYPNEVKRVSRPITVDLEK
jgi:hypothetical protein